MILEIAFVTFALAAPTPTPVPVRPPVASGDPKIAPGLNSFRRAFAALTQAAAQITPLLREHRIDEAITLTKTLEVRTMAFRLQGLGHLYQDADPRLFKEIRQVAKDLEDELGAYDLAQSLLKAATEIGKPSLIANASQNEQQAKRHFADFLIRNPLLGNPEGLRSYIVAVENFHWAKPDKDRQYVLKQFIDMVDNLKGDVKHDKFTRDNIEDGLHELRRRLRWVLISTLAMDGLVSDQSNPPSLLPGWQHLVGLQPSPYITYSAPYSKDPIIIPKVIFAAMNQFVVDIGKVKDQAEIQAGLGLPGPKIDHKRYASQVQAVLVRDEILESLEKILREEKR